MLITKDVEIWSPIEGYPGYEVSDHGCVRSLKFGKVKHLKQAVRNRTGHLAVELCHGNKPKMFSVHRLVLEHFVSPQPEKQVSRHLDGNPANNHVSNLVWGTVLANALDSVKHGTSNRKLTDKQALWILANPENLRNVELATKFNVSKSTITAIKHGYKYQHILSGELQ